MAKTRLNKTSRKVLISFVREKVKCPDLEKDVKKAEDKVSEILRNYINTEYGKDLPVLSKYGFTMCVHRVPFVFTCKDNGSSSEDYHDFYFDSSKDKVTMPNFRYSSTRLGIDKSHPLYEEFHSMKKLHREWSVALEKKQDDYINLINSSRTFEDVEEIWDEVSEIRSEICKSTALIAMSDESIKRIKKDVASRKQGK